MRNKEKARAYNAKWRDTHKEYRRKKKAEWRRKQGIPVMIRYTAAETKERRNAHKREMRKSSEYKEKERAYAKEYQKKTKERYHTDPLFKMKMNLRTRANQMFRRLKFYKPTTTEKLLGISYAELRKYIESKFTEDMTWENYNKTGWHIDHIVPLASAKTIEEMKILFHYTNLQPLWAHDNYVKGPRVVPDVYPEPEEKLL